MSKQATETGRARPLRGRRSLPVLAAGLALLALPAAGCGEGDEKEATKAKSSVKINIASFKFLPRKVTVKTGGTVEWTNQDNANHNAEAEDGSFNTVRQKLGVSKKVTLDDPGTYAYFCRFHRFMTGTVEVVE